MTADPSAAPTTVYDRVGEHGTVLLAGVVGSTAYGLAHAGSDTDRLGVYAAPTLDLCGLSAPTETRTYSDPGDAAFHEAAKYARLALAANPTVTELLWLPDHEIAAPAGVDLVGLRTAFLSAGRVRDAYLGYARSQLDKLRRRADGTFSSDTANRAAKHARHMARLVNQGQALYTTGHLSVAVDDPGWYHQFSTETPEVWEAWFEAALSRFETATTCLPEHPDTAAVAAWLRRVRLEHLA